MERVKIKRVMKSGPLLLHVLIKWPYHRGPVVSAGFMERITVSICMYNSEESDLIGIPRADGYGKVELQP